MMSRILVAVDGSSHSDKAFDVVVDIAQKYGSRVLVLHVFQGGAGTGIIVSPGVEDDLRAIGQDILDSYEARIKDRHLQNFRILLRKGDAARGIIENANVEECGLIVIGSRGRGGFKEMLPGSVSHKVSNHAGCPVLIVR